MIQHDKKGGYRLSLVFYLITEFKAIRHHLPDYCKKYSISVLWQFLFHYITLGTLPINDCKMFKMYKTASILLSLMEGQSREVLFGSGTAVWGGGGKLTS